MTTFVAIAVRTSNPTTFKTDEMWKINKCCYKLTPLSRLSEEALLAVMFV
jgi:hypothetical protein